MDKDINSSQKTPQASRFVTTMRKVYGLLGFNKGYNFPLFVIFAGAMFGFSLARLSYLNISGSVSTSYANSAAPGEWYEYKKGHYRIGITLHLATAIPAGLLMVWQFIPVIRRKALIFHRINGYVVMILIILSNVGALLIARRAFGGTTETQTAVGVLVILTTVSISMAYYNIKKLQIDQHRAWMLRTMFYMGTIITNRLIMVLAALVISKVGRYYAVRTCGQVAYVVDSASEMLSRYPGCTNATDNTPVLVRAQFGTEAEEIGAGLGVNFGMALWFAILLHLIGVEIYLALTLREGERLRTVSYEKQLEAGYKNPGSEGLTSDRLGDAEKWRPREEDCHASNYGK